MTVEIVYMGWVPVYTKVVIDAESITEALKRAPSVSEIEGKQQTLNWTTIDLQVVNIPEVGAEVFDVEAVSLVDTETGKETFWDELEEV